MSLKELEKIHGQYKMAQVKYISQLFELIPESYSYEDLCTKSRKDLRMLTIELYSKLEYRGYNIPKLRANKSLLASKTRGDKGN